MTSSGVVSRYPPSIAAQRIVSGSCEESGACCDGRVIVTILKVIRLDNGQVRRRDIDLTRSDGNLEYPYLAAQNTGDT